MKTRDEQHIGLEKIRAKRKVKKIKVFDRFNWMSSIGHDPLYLFIERHGLNPLKVTTLINFVSKSNS